MQKALLQMNLLAQLRNGSCKSSEDQIAKALTGTWRDEHLLVLQQALTLFDYYTGLIAESDAQIEQQFAVMKPRVEPAEYGPPLKARKPNSKSKNKPNFNARTQLQRVVGIDLTKVTGLSSSLVLTIIFEIGTDMTKWPTVKHFCS